jgi:hypothetical protein
LCRRLRLAAVMEAKVNNRQVSVAVAPGPSVSEDMNKRLPKNLTDL